MPKLNLSICSLLITANKEIDQKSQNPTFERTKKIANVSLMLSTADKLVIYFFVLLNIMTLFSFSLLLPTVNKVVVIFFFLVRYYK